MPGTTFIQGERIDLQTVEKEDIEFLIEGRNRPAVQRAFDSRPANEQEMRQRFEQFVCDGRSINLAVVPRDGEFAGEPIGHVWVNPIDELSGIGTFGLWYLPEARESEHAREAPVQLIDYAFTSGALRRLKATAMDANEVLQRVVDRAGFEHEGRIRKAEFADGEYRDVNVYGLLAENWNGLETFGYTKET